MELESSLLETLGSEMIFSKFYSFSRVFRKALSTKEIDNIGVIASAWIRFERYSDTKFLFDVLLLIKSKKKIPADVMVLWISCDCARNHVKNVWHLRWVNRERLLKVKM